MGHKTNYVNLFFLYLKKKLSNTTLWPSALGFWKEQLRACVLGLAFLLLLFKGADDLLFIFFYFFLLKPKDDISPVKVDDMSSPNLDFSHHYCG
jgi:hypothetical protein